MPVRILEDHVVNQIAAGEVVERPASVLRELLQNALDAGATRVAITLKNGGMALVRVVDDGCGMNRTDAMMALERHATSKIHHAADLLEIGTLGFRGEALPSIAAVSRFELRTRPTAEEEGTRIRVEGGTLRDVSPVGMAGGTEIDVRSLFYNLPARRKFLRTRTTELNHCLAAVHREVLMRPELDVVVSHEDRELLRAPTVGDLVDRIAVVIGDEGRALFPVDRTLGDVTVFGRVAPIGVHRSTAATAVYLYVNGRYVQDRLLRRAVYEAYRGRVPRGRYPVVVLDVRVPPDVVDVNVHPTKTEVRFHSPSHVAEAVSTAVRDAVEGVGRLPMQRGRPVGNAHPGPLFAPRPPDGHARQVPPRPTDPPPAWPPASPSPRGIPAHPDEDPALQRAVLAAEPAPSPVARPAEPGRRWRALPVIGLHSGRYLLCERAAELVVVDLAAAREALWRRRMEDGEPPLGPAQRLLAPARVGLPTAMAEALEQSADALSVLGVELDRFAANEVAVRGLPQDLGPVDPSELVHQLGAALGRGSSALGPTLIRIGADHAPAPEPLAVRTLLATLDEAGVPVGPPVAVGWPMDELARRLRRT